jgi:hypothetical protein
MDTSPVAQKCKTFRFVFSEEITQYLHEFSKIHQYDDRKIFKEEWASFIESDDVKPILQNEMKRVLDLGYRGDVLDKMFKSARYYFRNKKTKSVEDQDKDNKDKVKRTYITISKDIHSQMDKHILDQIHKHIDVETNISSIAPSDSFENYLLEFKDQYRCMDDQLLKKHKKTYKNRFYNIAH